MRRGTAYSPVCLSVCLSVCCVRASHQWRIWGAFGDAPSRCTPFLREIYGHSAWTSGSRPSVAGTLTLKQCSRLQNVSDHTIFIQKIDFFGGGTRDGEVAVPLLKTLPTPTYLVPFGAQPLAPFTEILNTPLPIT